MPLYEIKSVAVGTTAGTVAAGNDSRIVNAIQQGGSATLGSLEVTTALTVDQTMTVGGYFSVASTAVISTSQFNLWSGDVQILASNPAFYKWGFHLGTTATTAIPTPSQGTFIWDGSNFRGYVGGVWKTFTLA